MSGRGVRDVDSETPSATRHRRALEGYKLHRPPSYNPAFVRLPLHSKHTRVRSCTVSKESGVYSFGRCFVIDCPMRVVDDEDAIREMVTATLEFEGYAVASARNGTEALRVIDAIRTDAPDCPALVLLDLWMPELVSWGFACGPRP